METSTYWTPAPDPTRYSLSAGDRSSLDWSEHLNLYDTRCRAGDRNFDILDPGNGSCTILVVKQVMERSKTALEGLFEILSILVADIFSLSVVLSCFERKFKLSTDLLG